jgi:esterase/lipase superfamily enzyme
MNREYHKWFSPRLCREMELLIFGHAGARVLVFPTRQGRFYDYEDWRLVEASRECLESGTLQLFCVDSLDSESLYCECSPPGHRINRHRQYEAYILEEVVPFTEARNADPELVAHGCSIGAYHAVNIAMRHPRLFRKVLALSGRYDLTRPAGVFRDLFSGYYDEDIYFHTPPHFLPSLNDVEILAQLRQLDITLVVGDDDPFCESTRELSRILHEKSIPHRLMIWQGEAHKPHYWRQMVRLYLNGRTS